MGPKTFTIISGGHMVTLPTTSPVSLDNIHVGVINSKPHAQWALLYCFLCPKNNPHSKQLKLLKTILSFHRVNLFMHK